MIDVPVPNKTLRILVSVLGFLVLACQPALASDIPSRKSPPAATAPADPVEYCSPLGLGYFKVYDGACLKFGADLRFQLGFDGAKRDILVQAQRLPSINNINGGVPILLYSKNALRGTRRTSPGFDAQVNATLVSETAFGPLVAFANVRASATIGDTAPAIQSNFQGPALFYKVVDQAWVSVAGFTLGLHRSYFDFPTPGYNFTEAYSSNRKLALVAYSAAVDNASFTLSVEDSNRRRVSDGIAARYASANSPDIVGQLRYTFSNGLVQAAGAYHQIRDKAANACCATGVKSSNGWAVTAGGELRTKWSDVFGPAAGDMYGRVMLSGAYADGALSYLQVPFFNVDYIADENGRINRSKGFSAVLAYEHLWSPTLKSTISYSIYRTSVTTGVATILPFLPFNFNYKVSGGQLQVGTEALLQPDLTIGGQVAYTRDKVHAIYVGAPGSIARVGFASFLLYGRKVF